MVDEALKPALRAALRMHEIGNGTPYRLSFAGKGQSGGSFGFMQGDLAAGPAFVKEAFGDALTSANVPAAKIASLLHVLSAAHKSNPLGSADSALIDDALREGSALVDAMDERILGEVYADINKCIEAAATGHRDIEARALLYMALWINMTGAPSRILKWLAGEDIGGGILVPGPSVDVQAIEGYLQKQKYFVENPARFAHLRKSAAAGAALLPTSITGL